MKSKIILVFILLLAICSIASAAASDNITESDQQIADDIKVSFNDTVYRQDLGSIDVEIPENISGNLRATINDVEFYNKNVTSSVSVPITIPHSAEPMIVVNRITDHTTYHICLFFNNITILDSPLKVMNVASNFTTPGFAEEILKDDPEGRVALYFPQSANGEVQIFIDGKFIKNMTAEQFLFLNASEFNTLPLGMHNVTISYSGDSYYRKFTKTFNFTVVEMRISIPQKMVFDHDDCITAKILNNTDGTVFIFVDGKLVFKDKLDKYGEFLHSMFDDITCGQHIVEVQYNASKFTRSKKVTVDVDYNVDIWGHGNFVYGDGSNVVIIVPPDFNKNLIEITIDGKSQEFTIDDSGWIELDVSKMPAGNHTVDFAFKGDEKYHSWNESYNFTVIYQPIAPFSLYYGEDSIVSLSLPETAKGNLELYVDGKLYKSVKVVDGDAVIDLDNLIAGKCLLLAKYDGDDFEVEELNHTLIIYPNIVSPDEMYVGENGVVTVKTSKSANATVIFSAGDKNVTVPVVNGMAKLSLKDFKAGETDIDAFYIGENGFNCTLYAFVDILNTKIRISNVNVIYTNNAKVKVYINEKLAKNTYVTFKVSGKTLKVKTDKNGVATLKVNGLKPGKYNLQAIYGTAKTTKKLTVKHMVGLNTLKVKKSAKKVVLTAKLAKKLKNKVIKFKFNGKTLKVKTNSKGIAKVTFNVKNLKAGKKLTYSATYLKDTVKKTVKVTR